MGSLLWAINNMGHNILCLTSENRLWEQDLWQQFKPSWVFTASVSAVKCHVQNIKVIIQTISQHSWWECHNNGLNDRQYIDWENWSTAFMTYNLTWQKINDLWSDTWRLQTPDLSSLDMMSQRTLDNFSLGTSQVCFVSPELSELSHHATPIPLKELFPVIPSLLLIPSIWGF